MQLIVMIAIPGLIIALIALYEVMLLVQVQVGSGLKELLLSLLPSLPLSALGWYLKQRSQKKAEKSNDSETLQPMVENQLSGNIPLPVQYVMVSTLLTFRLVKFICTLYICLIQLLVRLCIYMYNN